MLSSRPIRALTQSARFIGQHLLSAPIVCSIVLLSACSTTPSLQQTPELQANLQQRCPDLPLPPDPMLDPARAVWENAMIALYGDCAGRHRAAVEAWPKPADKR